MKRICLPILIAFLLTSCAPVTNESQINQSSDDALLSNSVTSVISSEPQSEPSSTISSVPPSATSSESTESSEITYNEPRYTRSGWDAPDAYNVAPISVDLSNEVFFYMDLELEYLKSLLNDNSILGYMREMGATQDGVMVLSNGANLEISRKNEFGKYYINEVWIDFCEESSNTITATLFGIGFGATKDGIISRLGDPIGTAVDGISYYPLSYFATGNDGRFPTVLKFFIDPATNIVTAIYLSHGV